MSRFTHLAVFIATACLLLAHSCAGPESSASPAHGLPALATLDSRSPSGIVDVTALGKETLARSAGCIELGDNLYLGAAPATAEWSIYRLTPPAGMTPQSAAVALCDVSTDEAWTAIANYGTSRWDFSGPHTAAADFSGLDASYISPGGHVYLAVVVTGAHAGVVESVTLTSEGNLPPVALFSATPQTGQPGEPVTLDASGSSDPDGSIAKYEWDLDGDGSFEFDSGLVPTAPTALPDPAGSAEVGLRVTDDLGSTGTTTLTLTSSDSTPVDALVIESSETFNFQNPLLLTVNGNPACIYERQSATYSINYVRANDADGASWGATQVIATPEDVGTFVTSPRASIANGRPAIAYIGIVSGNRAVIYKQANDADGDSWGGAIPVATDLNVAADCSLAVVQGNPAIAYKGVGSNTKFVRAVDADGATWGTHKTCGISDDDEYGVSLAVVNGNPAVSFVSDSAGTLVLSYGRSNDQFGDTWASQVDILTITGASNGYPTFLTVANSNPALAYESGSPRELYFIRAVDTDGQNWDAPVLVYSGSGFCMSVINGIPAVFYNDGAGTPDLNYQRANDADGSSWNSPILISDTSAGNDPGPFLAPVNGGTAMVWQEWTGGSTTQLWYRKLD